MSNSLISRLGSRLSQWRKARRDVSAAELVKSTVNVESSSADVQADFVRGTDFYRSGQYERAVQCLDGVIAVRHDWADAHYYLGLALFHLRRFVDAGDAFNMALCFDPDMAKARFGLAHVENEQGRAAEALAAIDEVLRLDPKNAGAYNLKGTLQLGKGDVSGALESFESAVAVDPQNALGHSNLGYVLFRELGEYERGASHIEHALRLAPENIDILCNQTMVLSHYGEDEQAIQLCDRLLAGAPALHEARFNRALVLLKLGRFGEAWDDYEARKVTRSNYIARVFPCPEWRGEDLHGKRILIHGEQGLGDELMFASCFDEITRRAGQCVIECSPRLEQLFRRSFPNADVFAGNQSAALPKWWGAASDFHVAAGSLPRHFRRSMSAFPQHHGYMSPDPGRVSYWRERLTKIGPGLKVGISWRGGMQSTRRSLRSIDLASWEPILRTQGARFVSLQYGDVESELQSLKQKHATELHCWQEAIDDLNETAALIQALDLVISVCTAVVHLAGGIGRPVWVFVPTSPEWRYLAQGTSMPWYSNARLYRQRIQGEWQPVIEEITADLDRFVTKVEKGTDGINAM